VKGTATNSEAAALAAGFALWSLAFIALYGAHGLLCSPSVWSLSDGGKRAFLVGIWLALMLAQGVLIYWFILRLRAATAALRFIRLTSLSLAIAALAATAWIGLPVVTLHLC
jgi:hypothetical protein